VVDTPRPERAWQTRRKSLAFKELPAMTDFNEFNRGVISEFRENDGAVGGAFAGAPMILVNHRGARTGVEYTSPLVYTRDGDSYVVIASKGGAPEDPQWFRNLVANPDITVEVGADTIPVRARVAEGDERARLFRAQADAMPNFDEYAKATTREIPVVVLDPR
jgi:deazaflavin-dependent oxidoreductase (nitroreductase family)